MSCQCETMRAPGLSSRRSFGRTLRLSSGERKSMTTVASSTSVRKRSLFRNAMRSVTPAALRVLPAVGEAPRIDADADAARVKLAHCGDDNAPVATPEIVHHIAGFH